jgi:hypothetical protein
VADALLNESLIDGLRRDMTHLEDLAKALAGLQRSLEREDISFAVVGALALRQHGYARFTEDIDIVVTPEGLEKIHERLIGRGLVPRAAGLRKKLRDTVNKVNVDVIAAGEHAGSAESPVTYPAPEASDFDVRAGGVRYATLDALIRFKIASGVWGKRLRDLADVQELIRVHGLDESYATRLPLELTGTFAELVQSAGEQRDETE